MFQNTPKIGQQA